MSKKILSENDTYYSHIRDEIAQLLPDKVGRVMEIGCGCGDTLAWIKKTRNASFTCGVELTNDSAETATSKVDHVECGDFETMELPQDLNGFDVILCLDVLEHFVDPWKAVSRLTALLSPGGVLITSIPNVRYFSVVLPLLFKGQWRYQEHGILDRTHLRFFTRQTAIQLATSSGMSLDFICSTGLEKGRKTRFLNLLTFSLFKPLFEYQYLIKVKKILS